jgi:3-phosphoshikimate 1-carboxyvinyltransferase
MDMHITPASLSGALLIPPSKYMTHRALICAGLSTGESTIDNVSLNEDIRATIDALTALGATIDIRDITACPGRHTLTVQGGGVPVSKSRRIDCGESGSTLRFILPICCLQEGDTVITGRGRLPQRPLDQYITPFTRQGVMIQRPEDATLPLQIQGRIWPGTYELPGHVSSQFVTGLLFALPLLSEDSDIYITSPLESRAYVDMTISVMEQFGIVIEQPDAYTHYHIPGGQSYRGTSLAIEGDWSQAAFWMAAGVLGGEIGIRGLNPQSLQPDREIAHILSAHVEYRDDTLLIYPGRVSDFRADVSQCPDLAPVLAALASVSLGESQIVNAARLRFKESDRLTAIAEELGKMGASITQSPSSLRILGRPALRGSRVRSWNDHRIAMALAAVSPSVEGEIVIEGAEAVNKSYPGFWDDFKRLGGRIT